MDTDAKLAAAVEHHRLAQYDEADHLCREILRDQCDHPDALHFLGLLAGRRREYEKAIELIGRAIEVNDGAAVYHLNLGKILYAAARTDAAVVAYRAAIERDPSNAEAHTDLGVVLQQVGDLHAALAAYRRSLEIEANQPRVHYNLGTVLRALGRLDEAIQHVEKMLERTPRLATARVMLAGLLLERGDPSAALKACNQCLKNELRNRLALALKAIALAREGDDEGSRYLLDLDRLVREETLAPPSGYSSLEDFNASIAAQIRAESAGTGRTAGGATANAGQPEDLFVDASGALRALAGLVGGALDRYLHERPRDSRHPFLNWRPKSMQVRAWRETSDDVPQLREEAWLSGAYHVSIPSGVGGEGDGPGCLEVGQPPARYAGDLEFRPRLIRPRAGRLVAYPAYFFQRRRPFNCDDDPICIAFEALPVSPDTMQDPT